MNRSTTTLLALFLLGLIIAPPVAAQTPQLGGDWYVDLTLPLGEEWFNMTLVQKGDALTGHMVNDSGEFEVKGVVTRDQVKLEWSYPDGGRLLEIVFTGKFDRSSMTGVAKVGNVGEGAMSAQRR